VSCHRAVLGFLELSLRNPAAAIERLEPVLVFLDELGSPEPGVIPCVPDAIEALVSLGRLDEAEGLLDRLERHGRAQDRPWPSPPPRAPVDCSPQPTAISRPRALLWSRR
jgi:hypothetical protein